VVQGREASPREDGYEGRRELDLLDVLEDASSERAKRNHQKKRQPPGGEHAICAGVCASARDVQTRERERRIEKPVEQRNAGERRPHRSGTGIPRGSRKSGGQGRQDLTEERDEERPVEPGHGQGASDCNDPEELEGEPSLEERLEEEERAHREETRGIGEEARERGSEDRSEPAKVSRLEAQSQHRRDRQGVEEIPDDGSVESQKQSAEDRGREAPE
jgi:hypothetical protein